MFDTIFKCNSTITKHQNGSLYEERKQFIALCKIEGHPQSTLSKIAWILLAVADQINNRTKLTLQDIEKVVDNRKRVRQIEKGIQDNKETRQLFIHFTKKWIRYLGRFESIIVKEPIFTHWIKAFTNYLHDERGLSPITIATRCEHLKWFFLSVEPPLISMQTISITDVDKFIEKKRNQGWKRSSLTCLTTNLRNFFRYAGSQAWCSPNIALLIKSPRLYSQEKVPDCPSWPDVQRLLASTKSDSPANIRDHAILMLLALYGFRRGEVAQLQLDNLDWANAKIIITRPKQRCVQHYPLVPVAGDAILRYLREIRPSTVNRTLFLALSAPIRSLSAASITAIAHARIAKLGLNLSHQGAHCLRHACASHLLSSGFSLKQIGDYLGHTHANSVLSYSKIDLVGLRQVAEFNLGDLL